MTCNDCIHYEVCKVHGTNIDNTNFRKEFCELFKDKSHFVELPCKVGDTVYWIDFLNQINAETIKGFTVGIENEKGSFPIAHFGSTLFVTKEEAEKKLQKIEKKD